MSSHRSRIKLFDDTKEDTQLVHHFKSGACKDATFSVQIIENVGGNNRNGKIIDVGNTVIRRKKRTMD